MSGHISERENFIRPLEKVHREKGVLDAQDSPGANFLDSLERDFRPKQTTEAQTNTKRKSLIGRLLHR